MLTTAGVALALAAIGKAPMAGAGMIGYAGGKLAEMFMDKAGMADGGGYLAQNNQFAQQLQQMPKVLNAQGQPMADDYLSDSHLSDGEMYLGDDGNFYQVDRRIAPDFSHPLG